jgi:hypothetical protein
MNAPVNWFARGRDAFTEGKPCELTEARISSRARQKWRDGWNHQARLTARKRSPEEIAEFKTGVAGILEVLKSA